MATIVERPNKKGLPSYRVQVRVKNRGTGEIVTKVTTFKPDPSKTTTQNKRALNEFAVTFEKETRELYERGQIINRDIYVKDFVKIWAQFIKENRSPTYASSMGKVLEDISAQLGEFKLNELTPYVIQCFVDDLKKSEWTEKKMQSRIFQEERARQGITLSELQRKSGAAPNTILRAELGKAVSYDVATRLTKALGMDDPKMLFNEVVETRKYAEGTKGRRYRALRAMLSYAVKHQYIDRNYATSEYIDTIKERTKPREYLDDDEVKRLLVSLRYSENKPGRMALMILIFMGLRRGELCGLEWEDIDFDKATMTIDRASKYISGKGVVTGETKTEGSHRKLAIPKILVDELVEYKKWWDEELTYYGDKYEGSRRLFLSKNGVPINPGTVLGWLHAETDRAGLKRVSVHSLRHSNITIQLAAGVPLRTVAERAGHSTVKMTADIYAHMIKSSNREAADKLNELLGESV